MINLGSTHNFSLAVGLYVFSMLKSCKISQRTAWLPKGNAGHFIVACAGDGRVVRRSSS